MNEMMITVVSALLTALFPALIGLAQFGRRKRTALRADLELLQPRANVETAPGVDTAQTETLLRSLGERVDDHILAGSLSGERAEHNEAIFDRSIFVVPSIFIFMSFLIADWPDPTFDQSTPVSSTVVAMLCLYFVFFSKYAYSKNETVFGRIFTSLLSRRDYDVRDDVHIFYHDGDADRGRPGVASLFGGAGSWRRNANTFAGGSAVT